MPAPERIAGQNKGTVVLYALSTCIWCKKVKKLLADLNIEYDLYHMDLLNPDDKAVIKQGLRKFNAACSYPTLVINSEKTIIGFEEEQIRKTLG